jgi:glutathione peroxidase
LSIFDLTLPLANGETLIMKSLQRRVLLIVNTATACGFSGQLKHLAHLHEQYEAEGFTLIAAPCNQFSEQEPLDNAELCTFFEEKFCAHFPILAKSNVEGPEQSMLYNLLNKNDPRRIKLFPFIPWNFTKLLINREGELVSRFAPLASMKRVEKAVTTIL